MGLFANQTQEANWRDTGTVHCNLQLGRSQLQFLHHKKSIGTGQDCVCAAVQNRRTYNQYISDLKAGRKNSGEKKWAAIRVAGFDKPAESGASAAASTEAVLHEQEQQQQQHGTASANSHPVLLGAS
jgi:hypothetical protein